MEIQLPQTSTSLLPLWPSLILQDMNSWEEAEEEEVAEEAVEEEEIRTRTSP
jgi:hypothetical protein